jgi:hypothetical protein
MVAPKVVSPPLPRLAVMIFFEADVGGETIWPVNQQPLAINAMDWQEDGN